MPYKAVAYNQMADVVVCEWLGGVLGGVIKGCESTCDSVGPSESEIGARS
jgi:hypothetical protein